MTEQARAPRPLAAITGGSSGIGKAFAEALGPTHDLLLIARDEDRLAAVALDVRSRFGSAVDVLAADLSSDAGIELAAQRLAAEPALAMLINDAGFGSRGLFWETDFAGQVAMHQVHVMATMRLTHAALGQMVARNAGTIINVSSIAAFMRRAGSVSYCSTKSWVATFTEGLYLELESVGSRVRVQALCPGFTYSNFHAAAGIADRSKVAPASYWMTAQAVVAASLAALPSGKPIVIPGRRYQWISFLYSTVPTPLRLYLESPRRPSFARLSK
jgi:short-subunit dehydrogenase